jgi:hypothetical protein
MIYLLTAVGLSPGGSTHLHTNTTQNNIKMIFLKRIAKKYDGWAWTGFVWLTTGTNARLL